MTSSELERVLSQVPKELADSARYELEELEQIESRRAAAAQSQLSRQIEYSRRLRAQVQDIAPLPEETKFTHLRAACDRSLKRFCEIVFPRTFFLDWSSDHIDLLKLTQQAVEIGLQKAQAMSRADGKTSIFLRAAMWSILTGRRKWTVILEATGDNAKKSLRTIKHEINTNRRLAYLYPRETYALRCLENEARRCSGQRYDGEATNTEWYAEQICFGHIPEVPSSGGMITCVGITGTLRGLQAIGPDGGVMRPDQLLINDPSTHESAKNPAQNEKRYQIIHADAMNLAGPDTSISAMGAFTVIAKNDLAHRMCDKKRSPMWAGEICKMLYSFPDDMKAWQEYNAIRCNDAAEGGDGRAATEFYAANRDRMDKGARVAWPARYDKKAELSALQRAMNLYFRDQPAFFAEYQNSPMSSESAIAFELVADEIAKRTTNIPRNVVPPGCTKITAFIDVQKLMLYYVVMAWTPTGRGYVIDYGGHPDQGTLYWSKASIVSTLQSWHQQEGLNEALREGLDHLTGQLFETVYPRTDGVSMRLDALGIDARWGFSTKTVRTFCGEQIGRGTMYPMMGQFIGPNDKPWHKWLSNQDGQPGVHCRLEVPKGSFVFEILNDVNWWKNWVCERLSNSVGSPQTIQLFDAPVYEHQMFAEHQCAEESTIEKGKKQTIVIFKEVPGKPDNEYFDGVVGCSALASIIGVEILKDDFKMPESPHQPDVVGTAEME